MMTSSNQSAAYPVVPRSPFRRGNPGAARHYAPAVRVAVLAVALTAAACSRGSEAAVDAAAPESVTVGSESVDVLEAEQIQSGPLISGTLRAEDEATIRAEVGGSVVQVLTEQGRPVRRGQLLARIEEVGVGGAFASPPSPLPPPPPPTPPPTPRSNWSRPVPWPAATSRSPAAGYRARRRSSRVRRPSSRRLAGSSTTRRSAPPSPGS